MKPAAWSSRQKSLRGLAKCACAAAECLPGLIPQKTTASPGASTSGTATVSSRVGQAASGSRESSRASKASRIRSVSTAGEARSQGRPAWTTLTVSSLPRQP